MPLKEYRIVLLGNSTIGKTPFVVQFVSNHFLDYYEPSIEDSYRKRFVVDGEERTLNILDTCGCEEYSAMRDQYIRQTQGIILIYSITDSMSFNDINGFYDNVIRVKGTNDVPIVLVGNKCDLNEYRQVSLDQGEELAQKWNCPFFEVSTKENIHVEDVFAEIVRQIDKHEKNHSDTVAVKEVEEEKPKKEKKKRSFNPFNKYKFMDDI